MVGVHLATRTSGAARVENSPCGEWSLHTRTLLKRLYVLMNEKPFIENEAKDNPARMMWHVYPKRFIWSIIKWHLTRDMIFQKGLYDRPASTLIESVSSRSYCVEKRKSNVNIWNFYPTSPPHVSLKLHRVVTSCKIQNSFEIFPWLWNYEIIFIFFMSRFFRTRWLAVEKKVFTQQFCHSAFPYCQAARQTRPRRRKSLPSLTPRTARRRSASARRSSWPILSQGGPLRLPGVSPCRLGG